MVDYMRNRWPSHKPLPLEIKEFLMVKQTGWTLSYIRSLQIRDYEIINLLSVIYDRLKPKD
jgi:hypothetical protein